MKTRNFSDFSFKEMDEFTDEIQRIQIEFVLSVAKVSKEYNLAIHNSVGCAIDSLSCSHKFGLYKKLGLYGDENE